MQRVLGLALALLLLPVPPTAAQGCFDYASGGAPPVLGDVYVSWPLVHLGIQGDLLAVSTFSPQEEEYLALRLLDVQDPTAMTPVGTLHSFASGGISWYHDLQLVGDRVYLDTPSRFCAIDISDPSSPVLDFDFLATWPRGFRIKGGTLWLINGLDGLAVYDMQGAGNPALVTSLSLGAGCHSIELVGNYAYIAQGEGGPGALFVVDITDPAAPALVTTLVLDYAAESKLLHAGSFLYFADAVDQLRVVDVSDPAAPLLTAAVLAGRPGADCKGRMLAADGERLYLADGVGVRVVDIAIPTDPVAVGAFDAVGSTLGIVLGEGEFFVGTVNSGHVLAGLPDCAGTTAVPETPIAAAMSVSVHPNPFNPRTRVTVDLAAGQRVSVDVHDAQGRLLRRLFHGDLPAGRSALEWNGRDDRDRDLGSGVYYLRVSGTTESAATSLVLLR